MKRIKEILREPKLYYISAFALPIALYFISSIMGFYDKLSAEVMGAFIVFMLMVGLIVSRRRDIASGVKPRVWKTILIVLFMTVFAVRILSETLQLLGLVNYE